MQVCVKSGNVDAEHKTISFEVSELGDIESTMTVVSDLGTSATFNFESVERDADNDIVSWLYRPTQASIDAHPRLVGWKVIVYND